MLVVHLETGRHLYGGARQAALLVEALAVRGVDNLVVCAAGSALAARAGTAAGELIEWPLAGDLDWRLQRRLSRLFADRRPDLLHVHSRRGADSFGGMAARAAGLPAVLTRRVESAEPAFWLRRKLGPYAAIAAISTAVRGELVRCGIAPERIRLIPSAVDTALYRPAAAARQRLQQRYELGDDDLIAASVAQLIPRKGHDFLLALAARLRARAPRLRLLVFGRGPARAALERQARALGLAGSVRFCGYEERWHELLPGVDLLLHPARREGLGAAVLEAMAAGVPVLASAVGGLVDVIDSGANGRLLPPEAIDAWEAAVLALAADPAERCRLGEAARQKVLAAFTIEQMTDRYLALYRDVAG